VAFRGTGLLEPPEPPAKKKRAHRVFASVLAGRVTELQDFHYGKGSANCRGRIDSMKNKKRVAQQKEEERAAFISRVK